MCKAHCSTHYTLRTPAKRWMDNMGQDSRQQHGVHHMNAGQLGFIIVVLVLRTLIMRTWLCMYVCNQHH